MYYYDHFQLILKASRVWKHILYAQNDNELIEGLKIFKFKCHKYS